MSDTCRRQHLSFVSRAALAALLLIAIIAPYTWADTSVPREYEDFGRALTNSLIAGDENALQNDVDVDAILNRTFKDISLDSDFAKGVMKGMRESADQLGSILASQVQGKTTPKFVRVRHIKNAYYALVRVDFGEQGLNYLDFVLQKDPSGAIKIVDWYDYAKGQFYTESVRQLIVLIMPKERNLLEKILGINKLDTKEVDLLVEQLKLLKNGDYKGWLQKYQELPKHIQMSRIILVTRVMAANSANDDKEYSLALNDLYMHYGDDPTLGLLLVDHFYLTGDYENAKKSLKNLIAYNGGDAAIDNLMAKISQAQKNYTESVKYAEHAIKSDPKYVDAYFTLLDSSAFAGNYEDTAKTLEKLETEFGYTFDPEKLSKLKGYEGFAASSEFKTWRDKKDKAQ